MIIKSFLNLVFHLKSILIVYGVGTGEGGGLESPPPTRLTDLTLKSTNIE